MSAIRVLVADDHPIYRSGLRAIIASQPDLELVGEAATGADTLNLIGQTETDVVLMDVDMPDLDGITAAAHVAREHPAVRVLMFTMLADRSSVLAAMQAGACGYLVKGAGGEDVVRAIRSVAAGEVILGPEVATELLSRLRNAEPDVAPDAFPDLTSREREILELLAEGLTNAAIAAHLYLGQKTVRNYVSSIFRKLQVSGRVDAVLRARQAGLGPPRS